MSTERLVTRTFKCQLNKEMLHDKLNNMFVKETGYAHPSLVSNSRPVTPDAIRGTIHGIIDRQAIFEPAFLIRKKSNDLYEFGYILRGLLDSHRPYHTVDAIFNSSLKSLVSNNTISDLSKDSEVKDLNKNELIELGF